MKTRNNLGTQTFTLIRKLTRFALIMPTLAATFVGFTMVIIGMLWWTTVGWPLRWVFGRTLGGRYLARWLGCYPFSFILAGWLALASSSVWTFSRRDSRWVDIYSDLSLMALNRLHTQRNLKDIGGIW